MATDNSQQATLGAGLLASIASSLCCIVPAAAFIAGMSGAASAVSWVEPLRPYLLAFAGISLGFAWYQKLKPSAQQEASCDQCEANDASFVPTSFFRTKKFLGIVTVFALLMGGFPYYSGLIYAGSAQTATPQQQSSLADTLTLSVEGMTCTGCEKHIEHSLGNLDGVMGVSASYEEGQVKVISPKNDSTALEQWEQTIQEAGYQPKGFIQSNHQQNE